MTIRLKLATLILVCGAALAIPADRADACGGFFCQLVPIDQAGEQIIFRKDGDMVTAVVLIQYQGEAEDFSWVVPVPGIPERSIGSDQVFSPLELATRPQFTLAVDGSPCDLPRLDGAGIFTSDSLAADGANESPEDDVVVLDREVVGPFETVVVQSDDPEALAAWLEENDYDLTENGAELIAPYVEEGMNFLALRLRQDQGVGDLAPLIMRYTSEDIRVPIRLTAVAAQPNMGVLIWLLGDARGVPLNYLHVTPNYTLLNWYNGTFSAYADYQNLITAAMDEAGGQGFATDFAGDDIDLAASLPSPDTFREELDLFAEQSDSLFIASLVNSFVLPNDKVLEIVRRELPLSEGNEGVYFSDSLMREIFSEGELAAARSVLEAEMQSSVIEPLEETLAVFEGDHYLTRLYTTLSADEMTVDPTFWFNPDIQEDQQLERKATMNLDCTPSGTVWSLTLGEGTGRDGETVIEGTGTPPGFSAPVILQDSVFRTERISKTGAAEVVDQKQFTTAQVTETDGGGEGPTVDLCGALGNLGCGSGVTMLLLTALGLRLMRGRRG